MQIVKGRKRKVRGITCRLEALLRLNQMTSASLQEIAKFALEQGIKLTRSKIGYLAFLNQDETAFTMHAWSTTRHAGIRDCRWPDCMSRGYRGVVWRGRATVQARHDERLLAPTPIKKGCPQGHVKFLRHMNVPVFDGNQIVAVAGVGNKAEDYDETDVRQLTLLMEGMWRMIERSREEKCGGRTRAV